MAGQLREVVVVGANDVGSMIVRGAEGVYVVGTGNVGVAETFIALGRHLLRRDARGGVLVSPARAGLEAGRLDTARRGAPRQTHDQRAQRHIDEALKTPQFYLLWIVLCFNVTAGIGVLGVAQTMMTEIFGTTLPRSSTAASPRPTC